MVPCRSIKARPSRYGRHPLLNRCLHNSSSLNIYRAEMNANSVIRSTLDHLSHSVKFYSLVRFRLLTKVLRCPPTDAASAESFNDDPISFRPCAAPARPWRWRVRLRQLRGRRPRGPPTLTIPMGWTAARPARSRRPPVGCRGRAFGCALLRLRRRSVRLGKNLDRGRALQQARGDCLSHGYRAGSPDLDVCVVQSAGRERPAAPTWR